MANTLNELETEARSLHVPIMREDGMEFLLGYIRAHPKIMMVLECGTAVGWSAMKIAGVRENIIVDTLEIDPAMYEQAVLNIREAKLDDRVFAHLCDAGLFVTNRYYDLFFIDVPKYRQKPYRKYSFE